MVIADITDGDDAVEAITAAGGEASFVRCDVTDEASVENAVDFAVETYGGLHVLYNNAGVMLGEDDNPVLTWVTATGLRPVLDILTDEDERAAFVEPYAEHLAEAYPRTPAGVLFPFRRVFAVARKRPAPITDPA